ncbi:hypothetical protein M758_11G106800 [Ceratodon purpureus]|uniref:Secreted protein n=1 Tax=Ceratodon purpureus TaxID=3225 RepID=A0A8T0GGA7_CERPU|nr:hypothetical protein KC19_11G111300 [Ceratodon purpureus]KAG0601390.1 hypothetical protein M758_11G106800 [Ceratodon purpureus]
MHSLAACDFSLSFLFRFFRSLACSVQFRLCKFIPRLFASFERFEFSEGTLSRLVISH